MIGGVFACLASAAVAEEYDFCARGVGETFSRTVRVRLLIEGPSLAEEAGILAAELTKRLVWPERAANVFVERYDERLCSASLGAGREIAVTLAPEDVARLRVERAHRGPSDGSPTAAALTARARLRVDGARPAAPPGTAEYVTLQIFYATNRVDSILPDPTKRFGSERGSMLSVGAADVTIPKRHRMGELETPSIFRLEFHPDPEKHVTLRSLEPLDRDKWRSELKMRATAFGRPGLLLFIHGFNVSFEQAAVRTGQLAYDLAFPGPAVFFSWPSRGNVLDYNADQQAAEWSIPDMKTTLAELAGLAGGAPVYVIAHSMGTRILTRAFEKLLAEDPGKHRAFVDLVLTAPDIDVGVFKRDLAPRLLAVGPRITLYASDNDTALALSRQLSAGYPRLGEAGRGITVLPGMDTVDATLVKTDFIGHSYFGDSGTVLADLFYVIRTRLKPAERFALEPVQSSAGRYWRFRR